MPIPANIYALSTTPGSNSPAGSETAILTDDYLREWASYIALLRDVVLSGTSSLTTLNLTYTGTFTGSTGILNIGTGQVYKDASGNVGIGTAIPGYVLDGIGMRLRNTASGVELATRTDATTAGLDAGNAAGGMTFSLNTVERMRLDVGGNLGIGTASPSSPFNIVATAARIIDLTSTSASGCGMRFNNSGVINGYVGSAKYTTVGGALADFSIDAAGANNLILSTNDIERMRVKATGQINLTGLAAAPTGAAGDIYYDSVTNKHYGHNGSAWNALY